MTTEQIIITCVVIAVGTLLTRAISFMVFPSHKTPPAYIQYLGEVLPCAVIGLLIVYCLKDAVFTNLHGLPEGIAILFIAILHKWKKNTLLSIASGTIFYMFLVQKIFV